MALNTFIGVNGNCFDGSHYNRPDGSRGPVVLFRYSFVQLMVAVNRIADRGWQLGNGWWKIGGNTYPASLNDLLYLWQVARAYEDHERDEALVKGALHVVLSHRINESEKQSNTPTE
jgi:hypothetical protein